MSDTIVLKKIYALDSNTGLFLSSNKTLVTDGKGGAIWTDIYSTLTQVGGQIIGYLPSTISTFSTSLYLQSNTIIELQIGLSTNYPTSLTPVQLTSSLIGLGSFGYVSTAGLTSSIEGLGESGYVSSATLSNTVDTLGTRGYVSSLSLQSTVAGLGTIGYVSSLSLRSTVAGLGSVLYISTSQLTSTVTGLASLTYLSTAHLESTVAGLSKSGYISTSQITSTVRGLGTTGYISTGSLTSTVTGIQSTLMNVRFDNVGNVNVTNSIITFSNISTLLYTSTVYGSSFTFTASNGPMLANVMNTNDLYFSTASMDLSVFSNYIQRSTSVLLDIFPTYTFTKIGTGMGGVSVIPLSTMLQVGNTLLSNTTTTNFVVANQCKIVLDSNTFIDSSNVYQQPIRMTIPKETIVTFDSPYALVHRMPGALLSNLNQNGLNDRNVSVFFDVKKSIQITIQNIPGQ
jgi:DNA-binding MarR family transcriptional regulator